MTTITKMTARQFLMLGEESPGLRLELANGDIVASPSPAATRRLSQRLHFPP